MRNLLLTLLLVASLAPACGEIPLRAARLPAVSATATPSGTPTADCATVPTPVPFTAANRDPQDLVSDGNYVYWLSTSASNGEVIRSPVSGAGGEVILSSIGYQLFHIALDESDFVYFTGAGTTSFIGRVRRDGSAPPEIILNVTTPGDTFNPELIAVAPGGPLLVSSADLTLHFVARDGSTNTKMPSVSSYVGGIATDATRFWLSEQPGPLGSVDEFFFAGGGNTVAQSESNPGAIASSGSNLYWEDESGGGGSMLIRMAPADGSAAPITIAPAAGPRGIAADSSGVFWNESYQRRIWAANPDGSSPHLIACGPENSFGLVADAGWLYWIDPGLQEIVRIPHP